MTLQMYPLKLGGQFANCQKNHQLTRFFEHLIKRKSHFLRERSLILQNSEYQLSLVLTQLNPPRHFLVRRIG